MNILTKNLTLLLRDIIKATLRTTEQLYARSQLQRGQKTSVSLGARLDITKRITLNNQPSPLLFTMGDSASIETRVAINTFHGEVVLGNASSIGIGSIVIGPVSIGDNSTIAQHVFISGENRVHTGTSTGLLRSADAVEVKPVKIGSGVWVGANVTILPGVTIGDACIIAAGAVVTKDVPDGSVVAGVPAKVIKQVADEKSYD